METTNRLPWRQRVGLWGVGFTANFLMVQGFNLVLYPVVLWYFGLVPGAIIMWFLSLLVCYATIRFYDWSKTDWLGIETIKEVRDVEEKGYFRNIMKWLLSRGDLVSLFVLSVKFDAFICTVYMRYGAHEYKGMATRDWKIFFASIIISNAWWTIVVFSGLTLVEWVIHWGTSAL